MAKRRCENCGCFLRHTNLMEDFDEFDEELAIGCGYTDEQIAESFYGLYGDELSRFRYMNDVWECSQCGIQYSYADDLRHYYDPTTNRYDASYKPLTPAQLAMKEREAQRLAGQLSFTGFEKR